MINIIPVIIVYNSIIPIGTTPDGTEIGSFITQRNLTPPLPEVRIAHGKI